MYAAWKSRLPNLSPSDVEHALASLVGAPSYTLPEYDLAHTRHYMPDIDYGTDKVLDAFVVTERGAVLTVTWPNDVDEAARVVLEQLVSAIPYIGRADSLCELSIIDDPSVGQQRIDPVVDPLDDRRGSSIIRVLVPDADAGVAALTARTVDVRAAKLREPPGTRWVSYLVPGPSVRTPNPRQSTARQVSAVRWVVSQTALPSVHATLALTHVLRAAAQSTFGRLFGGASSGQLSGKSDDGSPMQGHRHAHFLAVDQRSPGEARGDGRVDHLVAWIDGEFDDDTLDALGQLHLKGLRGHAHLADFRPLRLVLESAGTVADVVPDLVGPSRVWESHTPFVPPRHRQRRESWEARLRSDLERELVQRNLPAPTHVAAIAGDWTAFRRHRPGRERLHEAMRGVGLRLEFDSPVSGPICIGRHSHFGLGLFVPIDDEGRRP